MEDVNDIKAREAAEWAERLEREIEQAYKKYACTHPRADYKSFKAGYCFVLNRWIGFAETQVKNAYRE